MEAIIEIFFLFFFCLLRAPLAESGAFEAPSKGSDLSGEGGFSFYIYIYFLQGD